MRQIKAELLVAYEPNLLEIDPDAVLASYEQGFLARLFSSSYKSYRNSVRAATKGGQSRSTDEDIAALRDVHKYREQLAWFQDHGAQISSLLGVDDQRAELDEASWEQIRSRISLAAQIMESFGSVSVSPAFVEQACQEQTARLIAEDLNQLRQATDRFTQHMTLLAEYFDDGAFPETLKGDLEKLERLLVQRAARVDDFDQWVAAQLSLRRVHDAGLQPVLQSLVDRDVVPALWGETYRRLVLTVVAGHRRPR